MTASKLAVTDPISTVPIRRILEGLARIHRWILVLDQRRRVVWMSDALRDLPGMEQLELGVDREHGIRQYVEQVRVETVACGRHVLGRDRDQQVAIDRLDPYQVDVDRDRAAIRDA